MNLCEETLQDVKHNCDVSDAAFWGYFSICGLLLRYRDLFRSENGLEPWDAINNGNIGMWISNKESCWSLLDQAGFRRIRIEGKTFDAFDVENINRVLAPYGFAYGAGYGMYLKPTFFLGRLVLNTEEDGHQIFIIGKEIIRDLFAASAMRVEKIIFLRNDPLKTFLWDAYTQLKPGDSSLLAGAFLSQGLSPGLAADIDYIPVLEKLVASFGRVLLRHEIAESMEAAPGWKNLLVRIDHRGAEHFVRAVQDLIADTSEYGPIAYLAEKRDSSSLFLYTGLFEGYRRALFSEIRKANMNLQNHHDWSGIDRIRRAAYERFLQLRERILDLGKREDQKELLAGILGLSQRHN